MKDWDNYKVGDTISFVNHKGIAKSFVGAIVGKTLITTDKHNLYIYKNFITIRNVINSKNMLIENNKINKKIEEIYFFT